MKNMKLRDKIGQMIMTGFPTSEITTELNELIDDYKIANIILFSYNLKTIEQVRSSCLKLHRRILKSTGYPAFIATDQEGGVVVRLPQEACNVPGAMLIGATGNKENAYKAGHITGVELKALGINMDLAPVLDINSNPDNPVIGVRSYSSNVLDVEEYGINMIKGLHAGGVMATVKHFPGHGDTAIDSHLGLPIVDKDRKELMETELIPFQSAINQGAPCVMTSHILFPKLESEKKPATMSKSILTGLLRKTMGFGGIIITDCLEMGAIQDYYGTAQGAVEAVKAGAQILCISHTPQLVREAIHNIENAVLSGEISMDLINNAVANILKYKMKYQIDVNQDESNIIGNSKHKNDIDEMTFAGITKISKGEIPDITSNTIFIGSYAYRSTLASSAVDKELHFAKYMAEKMDCHYLNISVNPEKEEISQVLSQVSKYSCIIYGLYNGHLNRGQIELANEISHAGFSVVAITLRNPYDVAYLDEKIVKIAAYEYNSNVFDALKKVLSKESVATGMLPIKLI